MEILREHEAFINNKILREHEAFIDKQRKLKNATLAGDIAVVRAVVQLFTMREIKIHEMNKDKSALIRASLVGSTEIVAILIDAGFDVDHESGWGTPLYIASRSGNVTIVRLLINAMCTLEKGFDDKTPLYIATKGGHKDVVKQLIYTANVRNKPWSIDVIVNALTEACSDGHEDIVKQLLGAGCTPTDIMLEADIQWKSPMQKAILNGHEDIVQQLIDAKFDIDKGPRGGIPYIFDAIHKGYTSIVLKLLVAGCKTDIVIPGTDYTPIILAISYKYHEIVRTLVQFGCNVNFHIHESPLCSAARDGENDMVCVLVKAGADKKNTNNHGETPLHGAVASGVHVVVQTLIDAGVDINARRKHGETPLFIAAMLGNVEIVNILLANGCDIEIPRTDGCTPLDVAIRENQQDVVIILSKIHFQNLYLAFAMSGHSRLGGASSYNGLKSDLMKQIFDAEQEQLGVNGMV